jgi:hypothetical protein
MNRIILVIIIQIIVINSSKAQTFDSTLYPLTIKFASICCGVPSDVPLKKEIKLFKTKNKIKSIKAIKISPMGKEGEYWICFKLKELSKKQKINFSDKLCKVTKKMTDRGNAYCENNIQVVKSELPQNLKMEPIIY